MARVISSAPVDIDGITAPARNYVPVGLGGEITTHGAPATIQFSDGTSVVLQANSQLKIDGRAGQAEIRIVRGAAQTKMVPGAHTQIAGMANVSSRMFDNAMKQVNTVAQPDSSIAEAIMAHATPSHPGTVVTPGSPAITGGFNSVPTAPVGVGGIFLPNDPTAGQTAQIISPGGLVINLTAKVDPTTSAVVYVVTSITDTITITTTDPKTNLPVTTMVTATVTAVGSSSNPNSNTSSLIGQTVSFTTNSTGTSGGTQTSTGDPAAGSAVAVSFTNPQSGVTTSGAAAVTAIQSTVTAGVTSGTATTTTSTGASVTYTAPANATIAPTTTVVTTGTFSPTGS